MRRTTIHFPFTLLLSFALLAGCISFLYVFLGSYTKQDEEEYQALISTEQTKQPSGYVSRQKRSGLKKNIFFHANQQRLQLCLQAEKAELAFEKGEEGLEIVEHMDNVVCRVQEKIYFVLPDGRHATPIDGRLLIADADPNDESSWVSVDLPGVREEQVILLLNAKNASYHYKNSFLTAENITLSRYTTTGHELETPLLAPEMMSVIADRIRYERKKMTLHGNVKVKHELGTLTADEMALQSLSGSEKTYFDDLKADGHVTIALNDGGSLSCSSATLDSKALVAFFYGKAEEPVVYKENHSDKMRGQVPIEVNCLQMQVRLSRSEDNDGLLINEMTADENVLLCYNQDFTAASDRAVYHRSAGILTMQGEHLCKMSNREGSVIQAIQIDLDANERKLTLVQPSGYLKNLPEDIDFSTEKLVWDDSLKTFTLYGKSTVIQPGIGELQTLKEVNVALETIDGKKVVKSITSKGDTILTYVDDKTRLNHTLKCYGTIKIDQKKMETRLQSPKNAEGKVMEGCQVFFQDAKGEIFADKAFVKYEYEDRKIVPARIVLQDNVKIINRLAASPEDPTVVQQYILAGQVDFRPFTKEMRFKGSKEQRIIIFDKANNLQVSATALKLIRDNAVKKESFQGLGDVRLSLAKEEFDKLRQQFSFDKDIK